MHKTIYFLLGLLTGLALAVLLGLGLTFLWKVTLAPLETPLPAAPAPANPADPLGALTLRVEKLENDQTFTMRDIAWKMDQRIYASVMLALIISALAAFFGFRTAKELDQITRAKVEAAAAQLDQTLAAKAGDIQKSMDAMSARVTHTAQAAADAAIARLDLDPREIPVLVQTDRNLDKVWARLKMTGFAQLAWYSKLDAACTRGIVIIPIKNQADEENFNIFLAAFKPQLDPNRVAFIIYAPNKSYPVSGETIGAFDNLVTANMPVTAANMALLVMRGLKIS